MTTGREETIAKVVAALRANAELRVEAQGLITAYIEPHSNQAAIMKELIRLFDGPEQREAQKMKETALSA